LSTRPPADATSLREAAFGNAVEGRRLASEGVKLYPTSQAVQVEAALAFAMAGDAPRAESLVKDLNKRFPLDTQVRSLWLPAVRAQLALNRKNPVRRPKRTAGAWSTRVRVDPVRQ